MPRVVKMTLAGVWRDEMTMEKW